MSAYRLTDELQVEEDGPVRIVRMNRPEQLNATNHGLHRGLAELFPQIDADTDARAVVAGDLDPSVAFMQGRMKVAGAMAPLLDLLALAGTDEGRARIGRVAELTEF